MDNSLHVNVEQLKFPEFLFHQIRPGRMVPKGNGEREDSKMWSGIFLERVIFKCDHKCCAEQVISKCNFTNDVSKEWF